MLTDGVEMKLADAMYRLAYETENCEKWPNLNWAFFHNKINFIQH